jgi:hypothetical protein
LAAGYLVPGYLAAGYLVPGYLAAGYPARAGSSPAPIWNQTVVPALS